MKSRAMVFAAILTAVLLFAPAAVEADKPIYPGRAGYLVEDNTCPAAMHVLLDYCSRVPTYLVFNRVNGLKRFAGALVEVWGPFDTTSCSRPLMDVRHINLWRWNTLEPCP